MTKMTMSILLKSASTSPAPMTAAIWTSHITAVNALLALLAVRAHFEISRFVQAFQQLCLFFSAKSALMLRKGAHPTQLRLTRGARDSPRSIENRNNSITMVLFAIAVLARILTQELFNLLLLERHDLIGAKKVINNHEKVRDNKRLRLFVFLPVAL